MPYHKFRVFTRTWWRRNPNWPDGREPAPGRKYTLAYFDSEADARARCKAYNDEHDPGPLSRKAEYEQVF